MNIDKIDREFYKKIYIDKNREESLKMWNEIKNDINILKEAIIKTKDRFNQYDTVKGITICEQLLFDYNDVNEEIYQELINLIYTNTKIARTVGHGASNGGYSYLLISLFNHNLKLTEKQKAFALSEAMNMMGTTFHRQKLEEYSKLLDSKNITNNETLCLELGNSFNPVGAKVGSMYLYDMFSSLSDTQAHGTGEFDIRYQILMNPNWTIEEKQKLVYDFYADEEDWIEHLNAFEWDIINDPDNASNNECILEIDYLYDYKYEDLLKIFNDQKIASRLWKEIEFCRLMKTLRPPKYEENKQKIIK